jgi:hypothetical protein
MIRVFCVPIVALIALVPPVARAQSLCSVAGTTGKCSPDISLNVPATITNPALLSFTVSPSTTLTATATLTDMNVVDGMSTGSIATVTVQGNRTWSISVKANSALWTPTGVGAWTTKPASDLHWSLTPTGTSTAISTTASTLMTGAPSAGTPISVYFRPVVHWLTDTPGNYTMGITFTITAP